MENLYYNFVLFYVLRTRHQVIIENEFVSLAADGLAQNDQRLGSNVGTDCTPAVNRAVTVGNRVQDAGGIETLVSLSPHLISSVHSMEHKPSFVSEGDAGPLRLVKVATLTLA